jgi:hypothetical protein
VEVREIRRYLSAFEHAYNGLVVFDQIVPVTPTPEEWAAWPLRLSLQPLSWPRNRRAIEDAVPVSDVLVLSAAHLESPGFLEFAGALNPLETIRKYLNDRHERKKDRDYRNAAERRKLDAEVEAAQLENLERRVQILKDLGVPADALRDGLLVRPLRELGHLQDDGLIDTAEWHELPGPEEH